MLRGRGDGSLEFSHRTFPEFLAARHIAALDEEAMIDAVMPDLHKAWWEEVHLLLFGELGGGKGGSGKVERLALSILGASGKPMPFLVPPTHRVLARFGWEDISLDGSFNSGLPNCSVATSLSLFAATANALRQQDRPT